MEERKIRLLIVDDEVRFLDAIAERLVMRGLDVRKASSGEDALELARTCKFDLALVDLKMPGMDGMQLLKILKQEHRFLEVIILTGHGALESAVEATKLGAYGYFPKPYEIDKLLESLREAYETRMRKKFRADEERMKQIEQIGTGQSPLGILRALRELDDGEK
jgi:two-component system NtrC family response regulator